MTSQRLVDDFAAAMWRRDHERSQDRETLIEKARAALQRSCPCDQGWTNKHKPGRHRADAEAVLDAILPRDAPHGDRIPDSYMNEAAVFLAGELGQRLQRGQIVTTAEELELLPPGTRLLDCDDDRMTKVSRFTLLDASDNAWTVEEASRDCAPLRVISRPSDGAS